MKLSVASSRFKCEAGNVIKTRKHSDSPEQRLLGNKSSLFRQAELHAAAFCAISGFLLSVCVCIHVPKCSGRTGR